MIALRDYQQEAFVATEVALATGKRPILALPTGAGKTAVAAVKIESVVKAGGRALFLVHRQELVEQAQAALAKVGITAGILKAEQREYDAPVVIASVQTAWRPQHLEKLGADFQLVVVDEAHHATATTWRTIIDALKHVPLLGLTATPYRADDGNLGDVFDTVAYQKTIPDLIPDWLCDIHGERVRVQADFNRLHVQGGDIKAGEAGEMLMNADAPAEIVAAYKRHAMGRKTLVFTPTIAVAEATAEKFREAGIAAEAISDGCGSDERAGILGRLRGGQTPVVTNCTILTEGFDCPDVSCIVIARPTKSKVLYVQMIGRGTRKAAGKADLLVLDTTGASERHDLITLGSLFGIGTLKPGESVMEGRERERLEREAAHLSAVERGRLVSTRVEMMREQALHWAIAPEGDLFVLSFGKDRQGTDHGNIRLVQYGGGWAAIRQHGADKGYRWEFIVTGAELPDATDAAEAVAAKLAKGGALVDRAAPWRKQPVDFAKPQVAQARKLKIPVHPQMNKGELSDKLSIAFARRSEEFRRRGR